MRGKFRLSLAAVVIMAVGVLVPTPAGAAGAVAPTLVAAGFDSPRGVEFFKGKLVVAEAGHGGKNCNPRGPPNCFRRKSQNLWGNNAAATPTPLRDPPLSAAAVFHP